MATRRSRNQARRSGQGTRSGMLWLAVGLAIGGIAFGYLHFKDKEPLSSLLPKPDPNAQARASRNDDALPEVPERPRPKYDFYTLLPEKEVVIPDAELDAEARAEAAREAQAAAAKAAAALAGESSATDMIDLDRDASAPTAGGSAAAGDAGTAAAAPAGNGPRYLIQAGAFRGNTEAEALKAQIALTGELARVEVAQINGNTVHRVRMGPYPNAASLAAAKAALAAHGIDAQAIRAK